MQSSTRDGNRRRGDWNSQEAAFPSFRAGLYEGLPSVALHSAECFDKPRAAENGRFPYGSRSLRTAGFTLVEVVLVVGLLILISSIAIPGFVRQIRKEELPGSARQFRSLLTLVRAHAALDGKRYRVRFPGEDELDPLGGDREALIEREDDPIEAPETFQLVSAPWAVGETLLGDVWCAEVRIGRPTIERLQERRNAIRSISDKLVQSREEIDPERPPLEIEADGTSEWVTFVLTSAPRDTKLEELEEYARIEVILDGITGQAWLQRPLYEEELDLFEERGWPAVLGQDYLDEAAITEDRVLELRDIRIRPIEAPTFGEVGNK